MGIQEACLFPPRGIYQLARDKLRRVVGRRVAMGTAGNAAQPSKEYLCNSNVGLSVILTDWSKSQVKSP